MSGSYPGGKNGPGTYQTIINQIPPHRVYVEPFAGSAAIYWHKRLATLSYLIELGVPEATALSALVDVDRRRFSLYSPDPDGEPTFSGRQRRSHLRAPATDGELASSAGVVVICADSARWLKSYDWRGDEFVYADPPYLGATRRRRGPPLYRHEIQTKEEHAVILDILTALPCPVIISGYWSDFYGQRLAAWRLIRFQSMTRGGKQACECLWMNYAEPLELHDYSYLGRNNRERQDLKRMQARWRKKIEAMPRLKKQALLAALKS